ncbi:response regulator [Pseudoalteromonas shioyasakiensis]|uniref:Response regulator n=1 Tax=Pseudoalteromonas shioyasakiensis TaxID=1190813 RepID=A0ABT6U5W4_9GAMM|nr:MULTISPECIES: response regulator [Pseudoalteromonas]MDI4671561.1 response regulator [Pseudoalteromonas shioyasakiensis]MDI4674133.1 response regulator [Pseudoalteromonas shioyasakiensis]MDI4688454.1 response regulator [Pseudoalteromonas shioyasakiensis]MDI4707066.1 response regulator [Pseudoalteromonas shioyasakiensis]NUJ23722.1 response regulator [Pseudoalteromonas sp. 0802]
MPLSLKPLSQCKVFIVDDDEMVRLSLGVILEDHFSVDAYSSGQAVLEACEDLLPDLILLDINLPDISGLDICRRLKAKATFENIPIISSLRLTIQGVKMHAGKPELPILLVNPSQHPR